MEATKNDELFDDELCGMVKFTDAAPLRRKPDDFCSYGERKEGAD